MKNKSKIIIGSFIGAFILILGSVLIIGETNFTFDLTPKFSNGFISAFGEEEISNLTFDEIVRDRDYITDLRTTDILNVEEGDYLFSYDSSKKEILIEEGNNIVIKTNLITSYHNVISIGGPDTLIAELYLEDFDKKLISNLFDSYQLYDVKNNYNKINRTFVFKYGIDWSGTECFDRGGDEICMDFNRTNWTEFTELKLVPKGIKIGVFTDTYLGEVIEWVPTIKGINIYQWAIWNISSAVYDSETISLAGNPQDLFIKPDGKRFYVSKYSPGEIHQYSCITSWDLSTCSADVVSITGQDTNIYAMYMSTNGSFLYEGGAVSDDIFQYFCSTPWDLSSCSYMSKSVAIQGNNPTGISFKPDGSILYFLEESGPLIQYDCSTPWMIDTCSYNNVNFTEKIGGQGMFMKGDGTQLFTLTWSIIDQFDCSTAWDVSSCVDNNVNFTPLENDFPNGLYFNESGTEMWELGNSNNIYSYTLTTIEEVPKIYELNITDPLSSGPKSVSTGDNITVQFNFTEDNVTLTSGVTMENVTIGGSYTNIIYDLICEGTLDCTQYGTEAACINCSECSWGSSNLVQHEIFFEGMESVDWVRTVGNAPADIDCNNVGLFNGCSNNGGDYEAGADTGSVQAGTYGLTMENWDNWGSAKSTTGIWYTFDPTTACGGSACDYINMTWWWHDGGEYDNSGEYMEILGNDSDQSDVLIKRCDGDSGGVILCPTSYTSAQEVNLSTFLDITDTTWTIRIGQQNGGTNEEARWDNFNITGYKAGGDSCSNDGACSTCAINECDTNCSTAGCSLGVGSDQIWYDNFWKVNVTVPTFASGLKDLFVNATYDGNTRNDTESNAINYGSGGGDTCTYSSGNWEVDCSDYCNITSNVNVGVNGIILSGTGYFNVMADITTNFIAWTPTCRILNIPSDGNELRVEG